MHLYMKVFPLVRPYVRPLVRPSVCPSIGPFIHPSICPSIHPSICLSVHPSVHLSIRHSCVEFLSLRNGIFRLNLNIRTSNYARKSHTRERLIQYIWTLSDMFKIPFASWSSVGKNSQKNHEGNEREICCSQIAMQRLQSSAPRNFNG